MKPIPFQTAPSPAPSCLSLFGEIRRRAEAPRRHWKILLSLSVLFFLAGGAGLFLHIDRRPDLPLLEKRFRLLLTWTLPEAHCDDVRLSGLRRRGDRWVATYRFLVHATEGAETSPAIRSRLHRRFPECGALLFEKGKACTVEERVLFVPVAPHGLIPQQVLEDHPELLSQM